MKFTKTSKTQPGQAYSISTLVKRSVNGTCPPVLLRSQPDQFTGDIESQDEVSKLTPNLPTYPTFDEREAIKKLARTSREQAKELQRSILDKELARLSELKENETI